MSDKATLVRVVNDPVRSRSNCDEPRDGELEPTILGGDRRVVHPYITGAGRGGRMIEDAGHFNDLTHWQDVGVLTGRI